MDNTRYRPIVLTGGVAGLVAALALLVNAAKRAEIIPTTDLTQLIAPIAQLSAIVLFAAILLVDRRPVSVGAGLAAIVSLASLVGVEFVINFVFAASSPEVVAELRAGPLGLAITVASVGFLVSTIAIVVAWWRSMPTWALLVYGTGAIVVSLRAAVPELILDLALVAMAAGAAGLAIATLRTRTRTDD